jgi:hypothetical protein
MKNKPLSAYEYLLSAFAGMVAREVVELMVEPVETLVETSSHCGCV